MALGRGEVINEKTDRAARVLQLQCRWRAVQGPLVMLKLALPTLLTAQPTACSWRQPYSGVARAADTPTVHSPIHEYSQSWISTRVSMPICRY